MARAAISRNTIFGWRARQVCFELIHGIISQCLVSIRSSLTLSLKLQTFINSEILARVMKESFFLTWRMQALFNQHLTFCLSFFFSRFNFWEWDKLLLQELSCFAQDEISIMMMHIYEKECTDRFSWITNQTERSFIFIIWVLKMDRIGSGWEQK